LLLCRPSGKRSWKAVFTDGQVGGPDSGAGSLWAKTVSSATGGR
jgi:hypothetical protein